MRIARVGRLWREEGQALAEFALVLPLLLLLVAGLIEFGRGWNIKQVVTDAAREGSRYAVVQDPLITSIGDVQAKVMSRLVLANLDTTAAVTTVSVTPTANFHVTGQAVTVAVRTKYRMGFVGAMLGWAGASSTVVIGSQSTMRNE